MRRRRASRAVALAIREHYGPKGPGRSAARRPPSSVAVALADKLDSLFGFFAAGIRPTGTRDPFALRRAGLGVIRLMFENELRLPLQPLFGAAFGRLWRAVRETSSRSGADRLSCRPAEGASARERRAARSDRGGVRGRRRGRSCPACRTRRSPAELSSTARTAAICLRHFVAPANIVAIEEKKDGRRYDGHPVVGALVEPEEEACLRHWRPRAGRSTRRYRPRTMPPPWRRWPGCASRSTSFFAAVMVNAPEPDLRLNRLLLLARIRLEPCSGWRISR